MIQQVQRTGLALVAFGLTLVSAIAAAAPPPVTELRQADFAHGTYIIDEPGVYRLVEDIEFNPNSVELLNSYCDDDPAQLPAGYACPFDAWSAGFPLHTQFVHGERPTFTPGGLKDARYDPAGFGLGFFAAIAVTARNVVIDLNGHTLSQSPEHALLQRFFALIELAEQPFIPAQGPADFGDRIDSARNVVIMNGTLGLSSHHGIHGNGNRNVTVRNVDFVDFEVAALALNGVERLYVRNATARNRTDVPVLGTFSSAQFIKPYLEHLVRSGSTTTLNGASATEVRDALRQSVINVHHDLIVAPNMVDGRARIDAAAHPAEADLYDNPLGIIDGNSYSFLVNPLGVAVNGFPNRPAEPSRNIIFSNVRIDSQRSFINEIVTLNQGGAVIDPVGAVFQTRNLGADGMPITVGPLNDYVGNVVADAQALVAKAIHAGDFDGSPLDIKRNNLTPDVVAWVEGAPYATIVDGPEDLFCNGDSMFHVNKGAIGFKMDGADNVLLHNVEVGEVVNLGDVGSDLCGDYTGAKSHPLANLPGYGGARARAVSIAGSSDVVMIGSRIGRVEAAAGSATGVDVMTDSRNVMINRVDVEHLQAGLNGPAVYVGPNETPEAVGFRAGADTARVRMRNVCAELLDAFGAAEVVEDDSGAALIRRVCR